MAKVVFGCLGKFLKGSGIENIFIETDFFGVNVADQALNGSHYSRAVKGYFILGEALTPLQIQSFFTQEKLDMYDDELQLLDKLKDCLM